MRKPVLIVVGQTPPPHNGQAKMIQQMLDGMGVDFDVVHIRMAYSDSIVAAGKFGWGKIVHLLSLIRQTRSALDKHPDAILYYPPASPNWLPVLRDLLFLSGVRRKASQTIFHFHSGGLSHWLKQHPHVFRLGGRAFLRPDLAIELGESCPRDGAFLGALQTVVVPNGVDVPVLQGSEVSKRSEAGLNILYVGIHTESKGLFDLLETARELKRQGLEFTVKTVGLWYHQQERELFERKRAEYDLTQQVDCVGELTGEELWRQYAWADLFFFPTHYPWETCGIVQFEAMAYGLPIVATDWPGPRDVVLPGQTGLLVPPRDVQAMVAAISRLALNRDERLTMGAQGRARYQAEFTAQVFIGRMRDVFLGLVAMRSDNAQRAE
jgi:glycosyltransferase involved in cell wall biosynthesis